MNRKALSLLIAAVVVFSIVPLGFAATVQVPNTLNNSTLGPVVHGKDTTPITPNDMITSTYHRTGLKWIPLKEYEKVTGTHFKVMNPEAFKRALQNAPFYPRIDNGISGGKLTSTPEFSTTSLPKSVVNTVYLPPIGDQGYVGSCNAWSSTYYVWTYMLNWWRNNPFPTNPHDIMNPTFTYNLINGGEDQGSFPEDAMNLISTIGAVPESDFPVYAYPPESVIQAMKEGNMTPYYQWDEYVASVWPNLTQWEEAPHNKANYLTFLAGEYSENIPGQWYIVNLTNETQWNYLKGLLAKGYVLQTAIAVWSSFSYLDHPENVVEDMETYLNWTAEYIPEYWTNESYENGTYVNWTVGDMINQAVADYKEWANYTASSEQQYEKLMSQLNVSLALFLHVLTEKYNVSLSDTIPVAYQKLYDGVQVHFINNQSWWNNATFYLGTYSLGGEQWFLNHGFDSLYVIHNFELMVHHIPIGDYIYLVANLNFYNYDTPGGHAVTIIGYNDDMKTPDGEGALVMVNSWGTNWGRDGYWYFSYDAVRGAMANLTVDGILTLPNVTLTFGQAFVYVPKAANYQPKLLSVVGIHHPIRGETFSGFVVYNESNWDILAVPKEAGLDIGVSVNGSEYSIPFMDFVANYMWVPVQWVLSINYTNATQLASYIVQLAQWLALKYNLTYEYVLGALLGYPQVHPFPNSPMAFDVSDLGSYLTSYIDKTGKTPLYVDFYVNVSDALPDSVTGYLYNFTLLYQGPDGNYYPIATLNVSNVSIPDGRWKVVDLKVPVVQYWKGTPSNDTAINFGNLNVSVLSIVPLRGAKVIIDGKSYNLTAENGGYYYYATGIDQKLKLPAGTYNYTVIVTYPNGKEVKLPQRTVIVRGPLVDIVSPKPSVYNTSMVSVKISINDTANVSVKNITVLLNGKVINVVYNSTSGLYEGALNLTNGNYHLVVTAVDKSDAFGTASVSFIVNTNAKVVRIPVNSETNVTVGVIGSANVTAENNTIVANVTTSNSTVEVQVPLVNNVPSVIINTTAINSVITGGSNASLVAGWNASATASTKTTLVKTENSKKIYAVTIKANVSLGENGVAVVAFRNINISKVYVWKNGQKIQLTTNESNPLGYYYIQGNVVFVVLKEDPIVEVDGTYAVPITPTTSLSSLILMLNYMYYHYIQTQNATFHELYNKALEAGVNETILQQVMEYYNQSMEEYATAKDLVGGSIIKNLGDFRLFIHLRKSYADLKKAIRILQQALEEQGS